MTARKGSTHTNTNNKAIKGKCATRDDFKKNNTHPKY